jgi:HSP20 family molecular chaperone IbpA
VPDDKFRNMCIETELPGLEKQITRLMQEGSFLIRMTKEDVEYTGCHGMCKPTDFSRTKSKYRNGLLFVTVPYR